MVYTWLMSALIMAVVRPWSLPGILEVADIDAPRCSPHHHADGLVVQERHRALYTTLLVLV